VESRIVVLEENEEWNKKRSSHSVGEPGTHSFINKMNGFINELIIDKVAYSVYLNNRKSNFPKKEFELLLLLASNPKKVFKREDILIMIWGVNYKPRDSRSLDVHIRMLRKKLNNAFITTIRGVGYKLEK
jgi:DNA-binding response OmpR family regulator